MKPYYQDDHVTLYHGDCIETMRTMPDSSIDSIVTDPPYGLGFMGKKWDSLPPGEEWARECLRVLKPGGHILAFGGSRTWHRLAVAIEDAGFEIRDGVLWLYGSGFPKSHDVSKAIDKMAGAERTEVIGKGWHASTNGAAGNTMGRFSEEYQPGDHAKGRDLLAPATSEAQQWEGWGTALKPAFEPIVMARKPLAEKTVARNVLAHGTGAINIDASRIATDELKPYSPGIHRDSPSTYNDDSWGGREEVKPAPSGRFPANLILDEHTAELLDQQSGHQKDGFHVGRNRDATQTANTILNPRRKDARDVGYGGSGGASRFFYVAKAPKSERPVVDGTAHPTVKPLALMRWLCKLVTPAGGTILDPFAGSGTTIEAALIEGFNVIGIERETEYLPLIQHRINRATI